MLIGLRTAIYPVADLAAAKDWYVQVLDHQRRAPNRFGVSLISRWLFNI